VFVREGHAGYITPCRVLVVVPIASFLPSVKGLEFPLLIGVQGLSCSRSKENWVSVHCGG
jgi:hypothetical protein